MSVTKRGMAGSMQPHPLVVHKGLAHFSVFICGKSCEFPTSMRAVEARFARSNMLYKRIRSVLLVLNYLMVPSGVNSSLILYW